MHDRLDVKVQYSVDCEANLYKMCSFDFARLVGEGSVKLYIFQCGLVGLKKTKYCNNGDQNQVFEEKNSIAFNNTGKLCFPESKLIGECVENLECRTASLF